MYVTKFCFSSTIMTGNTTQVAPSAWFLKCDDVEACVCNDQITLLLRDVGAVHYCSINQHFLIDINYFKKNRVRKISLVE